jgi:hypothetical protein
VPYDLRHSFASLLLHEGRSVIHVARQLGHNTTLTLKTYGHVIDELDDQPAISAEDAIRAARDKAAGDLAQRPLLQPHRLAGYKARTGSTEGWDDVAEPHSRFRNWAFIAAFTLIIVLTVAEGVDEGFSVWDWLVIAVGAVFILQALFRLNASRSSLT